MSWCEASTVNVVGAVSADFAGATLEDVFPLLGLPPFHLDKLCTSDAEPVGAILALEGASPEGGSPAASFSAAGAAGAAADAGRKATGRLMAAGGARTGTTIWCWRCAFRVPGPAAPGPPPPA
jgi:hypothetical protein